PRRVGDPRRLRLRSAAAADRGRRAPAALLRRQERHRIRAPAPEGLPVANVLAPRRLGLVQAAASLLALAGVVWWASRQQAPHLPLRPTALAELAAAVSLYALVSVLRAERWHRILV